MGMFQPATATQRYLKVLLHGTPGTGKTLAALSFPGPLAVLDLEGGTDLYAGAVPFDVLRTKDIGKIESAIRELGGGKYQTIVIDPLTVLWQLLQAAGQALVDRRAGDSLTSGQALSPREWGIIKRRYASILTQLINLPMHVVLVSRDTDLYEGEGNQLKKVGTKADIEKSTAYVADFVLWCQATEGQFTATVEKSRSDLLPIGKRVTGYTAKAAGGLYARHFAAIAAAHSTQGAPVVQEDEASVAAHNAVLLEMEGSAPTDRVQGAVSRSAVADALPHGPSPQRGTAPPAGGNPPTSAPAPIHTDDLATIKRAYAALGWDDKRKYAYLREYRVTAFSDLNAEQGRIVATDLDIRAAQVTQEVSK